MSVLASTTKTKTMVCHFREVCHFTPAHGIAGLLDRRTVEKSHFGGFGDEDAEGEEDADEVCAHFGQHAIKVLIPWLACT